jgi:hypothetical protein
MGKKGSLVEQDPNLGRDKNDVEEKGGKKDLEIIQIGLTPTEVVFSFI